MIRKRRAQSSSLFLMELILAILFFSITSAVCVQFFVKSHLLSQRSQVLTQAVNECSSIAEIFKTSDSLSSAVDVIVAEYPSASTSISEHTDTRATLVLYFDEQFVFCDKDVHTYELRISLSEENTMLSAQMEVQKVTDASVIYQLDTVHHLARRTAYEEN